MTQSARSLHPVSNQTAPGAGKRLLKRGELLFSEGENSRAMYLIKSGMIRIFKKKGDSEIEIDTIRSGQIFGELAFLDGNPRSASAEALTDCELMEISGPTFVNVLQSAPEWLKLLLKTVVGRLRTASTRIKQLEQASSSYDYSDKDGKRSAQYVYLSTYDVLKVATALLLVGSRNGKDIRVGLLQRYGNQIIGIPVAKITSCLDVFSQAGIVIMGSEGQEGASVVLSDIDFLEQFIAYLNEENLLEPTKRHDITVKGFLIMSLMAKHLATCPTDPVTAMTTVNLAEISKLETPEGGKEPFRMEEFPELVKLGYATALNAKSANEMLTTVKADSFTKAYRMQRVIIAIHALNESKRKGGR